MYLYYSNYCDKCKKLLSMLHKSEYRDRFKYICIDNRVKENDKIIVILQNGYKLYLPPVVTKVPTLHNDQTNNILVGEEIMNFLRPPDKKIQLENQQVNSQPEAFGNYFDSNNSFGVMSDSFSFLNQSADELSAKGSGGVRQMYNYCGLNETSKIYTPEEEENNSKIGPVNLDDLQSQRNRDIKPI